MWGHVRCEARGCVRYRGASDVGAHETQSDSRQCSIPFPVGLIHWYRTWLCNFISLVIFIFHSSHFIITFSFYFIWSEQCLRTSRHLHVQLLQAIEVNPMSHVFFFHSHIISYHFTFSFSSHFINGEFIIIMIRRPILDTYCFQTPRGVRRRGASDIARFRHTAK